MSFPKKSPSRRKNPIRWGALALIVLGVALWSQESLFEFLRRSLTIHSLKKEDVSSPKEDVPTLEETSQDLVEKLEQVQAKQDSGANQASVKHKPTSPTITATAGHFPQRLFPKNWLLTNKGNMDLTLALIARLMNELDWPKQLRLEHLHPQTQTRTFPGRKKETFVNIKIQIKGFWVPQSYIRVMMFEKGLRDHQITMVDHRFDLPPEEDFSIQVSQREAIKRAQLAENDNAPLWQASPEWRQVDAQWKPTWKIQLQDSPHTYYIDARNGHTDVEDSELGVHREKSASKIKPKTETPIFVRGMAHPIMSESETPSLLSLPEFPVFTNLGIMLLTDTKGSLITNEKPESLQFVTQTPELVVLDRWDTPLLVHIKTERNKTSATLNPEKKPEQAALLNAFLFTQQAREFLITKVGFQRESLSKKLSVMVNSDLQDCNAHYRHGLMTFYTQSENCRNTAYDTVIFHEFAHYVDDLLGGVSNVALSEGMGDVLAIFVSGQPAIGQHLFRNSPSPMRSADNTSVFEPSAPTYAQAQAWSGFAWRARQSLIEKYGSPKGESLAQLLFLAPLESEARDIPSAAAEVFARAAEGQEVENSPDFPILQRAALSHGLEWKGANPIRSL